jgi:hypothetical protein
VHTLAVPCRIARESATDKAEAPVSHAPPPCAGAEQNDIRRARKLLIELGDRCRKKIDSEEDLRTFAATRAQLPRRTAQSRQAPRSDALLGPGLPHPRLP